jgi:pimeloyl-ACP methyl ester carboxylesterase
MAAAGAEQRLLFPDFTFAYSRQYGKIAAGSLIGRAIRLILRWRVTRFWWVGEMATFVLVHGSWLGGWCWKRLRPRLAAAGHEVLTPTLTGLGDRAHLGGAEIDLDLHVRDLRAALECEEVEDAILVGHSYAGLVVTAVADALPGRVAQIVYLDAVVPEDGRSILDMLPSAMAAGLRSAAAANGGRFPPAPPSAMGVEDPADARWLASHAVGMPLKTHDQPLILTGAHARVRRRAYIRCTHPALDALESSANRARAAGWDFFELRTGHDPMITMPIELAAILLECAGRP